MTMHDNGMGSAALAEPGEQNERAALGPKAARILDGARSAFHELGFEGTSVDEIARRAGVSKPTLYSYFGDKQALFAASFSNECKGQADDAFVGLDFSNEACVETALRSLAKAMVRFTVSPAALSMFRSAVAESARFPHLGRTYFETGEMMKGRLVEVFKRAIDAGVLAIDDLDLAAYQFMVLSKADLFYKRLFLGDELTQAEVDRVADGAVKLFVDGYRKRG